MARESLKPVTLIVLALGGLALLAAAVTIPAHYPFNSNEGWNALHALDVLTGTPLYRYDGFSNFPNYPPAYFYVLAGLGTLFGDMVIIGRIIALLSLIALAYVIGRIARRIGAGRDGTWLAGGLFLLFIAMTAPDYMATSDPQLPGHLLQAVGLLLLVERDAPPSARRLAGAMLLMLAGGLFKHNLVVLPLAVAAWLFLTNRRAFAVWLILGLLALAGVALIFWLAFGPDAFLQILGHKRLILLQQLLVSRNAAIFVLPLALIAGSIAWANRQAQAFRLLGLYLTIAAGLGFIFALGRGVGANAWFDLAMAATPLVGVAASRSGFGTLAWLPQAPKRPLALAGLAMAGIVWSIPMVTNHYSTRVKTFGFAEGSRPVIDSLASADGPVACEDPTFCYWAGRPNSIDFSNTLQRVLNPGADQAALVDEIASRRIVMLQSYHLSAKLPQPVQAALEANYSPTAIGAIELYEPKP